MAEVAGIIAPVFVMVLLGAGARMRGLLDIGGLRGLNDLTFFLAIPALLFGSVVEAPELHVVGVPALYFAGCLAVFAAGVLLARRFLGAGLAQASVVGLNACYGNTVMLGIPIVSAAFGAEGLAIILPVIALHSLVLLPLATALIEADGVKGAGLRGVLRGTLPALLRNPIIVALLLAMAWRGLGVPVPTPLHRLLAMLGGAGPALALFTLGAGLPDFAAQGSLREAGIATLLKLVAQPLLVWGLGTLAGLGPVPMAVAVVTAGTPTGANAFFLARRTGTLASASAGTVVLSTALSVLTLSAILAGLR